MDHSILLTFVTTTIFWLIIKYTISMFKCVTYKKDFNKSFNNYWNLFNEQFPGMNKIQVKIGYRAGYHQMFFGKCITGGIQKIIEE